MSNRIKKLISIIVLSVLMISLPVSAATVSTTQVPYESYTYWEGFSGKLKKAVYSKPMYEAKTQITANSLGVDGFSGLKDVFADSNNNVYILDSVGPRIVVLNEKYEFIKEIKSVNENGTDISFKGASGLFVSDKGKIYIADTNNSRVLITDQNGNLIKELGLPESSLIPESFVFRPTAVAVNSDEDIYVLSDGSFYGAIVYDKHYQFQGFYGSNSVKNSVLEGLLSLWNKLFLTDEKRENSEKSLPYQFTDLCIDSKGFIYTTTGKTETEGNSTGQIKKLSPSGISILGGDSYNYVDEGYSDTSGTMISTRIQDLLSLDVDDNGYIFALDSTYGRIFVYNSENRLMTAFGGGAGNGNHLGLFKTACAIAENNGDILVCDSTNGYVTVFSPTEYGKSCMQANLLTSDGDYLAAKPIWEEIHNQDSNNQMAYAGLAKAYLAEGDYSLALEYAKSGYDRDIYDQAFEEVRNQFIRDNFTVLFLLILLIAALIIGIVLYVKKKKIRVVKNKNIRLMFSVLTHPVDSIDKIKEKNEGSVLLATIIVIVYYIVTTLKSIFSGFSFSYFDASTYNSLFVLVRSAGAVLLWTVCNWAVCTLFNGKGTIRNIYISTSYCILPLIFGDAVYLIASNFLTSSEGAFLNIFSALMIMATAFYLIIAMIRIHDFSFGNFALTTILSIFGMVVMVFFIFLICILFQQLFGFLVTLISEIVKIIGGKI